MQTALITGGSRGIGAAMVRAFSQEGWRVAFGYHQSESEAEALSRETGAIALRADLRLEEGCLKLYEAALRQLGHLDALILNAGTAWQGLLTDMSTEAYRVLMALQLDSCFYLSRLALPGMQRRGAGCLLFISSMQGLRGASCEAAYAAAKAGQLGLMRSLAMEWGPCGIRINALAPGVINTDMMAGYSGEDREALRQAIPLKRLGEAAEVAQAALFLCGPEAGYITGQVLPVDGGWLI